MSYREEILRRFEGITKPLTKTQAQKSKNEAKEFKHLIEEGEIVNLGTKSKTALVTRTQVATFSPNYRELILKRFEGITKPLTKTQACKSAKEALDFEKLLSKGELVNLALGDKDFQLVTKEQFETTFCPEEAAKTAVLNLVEGGIRLIPWNGQIIKTLKISVLAKSKLSDAIGLLQKERRILLLVGGSSTFLISGKALLRHFESPEYEREVEEMNSSSSASRNFPEPTHPKLDSNIIRNAFTHLIRPSFGETMVTIGKLQRFLKVPLAHLQAKLDSMNLNGEIEFPRAEITVLTQEERDAAFYIERIKETVHFVRFR